MEKVTSYDVYIPLSNDPLRHAEIVAGVEASTAEGAIEKAGVTGKPGVYAKAMTGTLIGDDGIEYDFDYR